MMQLVDLERESLRNLKRRPRGQETIDADCFRLKPEYVLQEVAQLAFFNIGDVFDAAGHVKPAAQLSENAAAAASVDVRRYVSPGGGPPGLRVRVRLWDKLKALELLAKHFGLVHGRHVIRAIVPKYRTFLRPPNDNLTVRGRQDSLGRTVLFLGGSFWARSILPTG